MLEERMAEMLRSGCAIPEIASHLGVTKVAVMRFAFDMGATTLVPNKLSQIPPDRKKDNATDARLAELLAGGLSTKQIAFELGVSRQRVQQRMKRSGLKLLPKEKPQKVSKLYGMPMDVVRNLVAIGATRAYACQRRNAADRGIGWELTFAEWWEIWEKSGKWDVRGRNKGCWVMGRPGDIGPYAAGNVVICTHSENATVAQSHARRKKAAAHIVTVKSKTRPYAVKLRNRYFGSFATRQEALAKKREIDIATGANLG